MCGHQWHTMNGIRFCTRCGLSVRICDGKVMLDRALPGVLRRKRKGKQ